MLGFFQATAPYWLCVIAYAAWHAARVSRGGEKSIFMQNVYANPMTAYAPMELVFAAGLLGVLIRAALWPVFLALDLVMIRRGRHKPKFFENKTLAAVHRALMDHSNDYEAIFTANHLPSLTDALHNIDLGTISGAETYDVVIAAAWHHLEIKRLWEVGESAKLQECESAALAHWDPGVYRAGNMFCAIIMGYALGRVPEQIHDSVRKWYAEHARSDADADLIHDVFSPIKIDRFMQVVKVKVLDSDDDDTAAENKV